MQTFLITHSDNFQWQPHDLAMLVKSTAPPATDLWLFDPVEKSSISIESAHELIKWSGLKPFSGDERWAVILQAHKLTLEAQNALLKLLEEPPRYLKIFLLTPYPQQLLATVLSRAVALKIEGENEHQTELQLEITTEAQRFLSLDYLARLKLANELLTKYERPQLLMFVEELNRLLVELVKQGGSVNREVLKHTQTTYTALLNNANLKPSLEMLCLVLG